jgi:hypothetical protein
MFARLIGVDNSMGKLPRTAVNFYLSLLNRIHARAGPLVSEAVEGFSFVRCKIVSRVAREMLRYDHYTWRERSVCLNLIWNKIQPLN